MAGTAVQNPSSGKGLEPHRQDVRRWRRVRPVSCIEWPRSRISYIDCRSAEGGGYNQDNKSQQYRLNILSSEETEDAHADTQTISASSSVGYEAAMKKHSDHGCKHGSAAPIFIRLEGCINDETEDFWMRGHWLRPGWARQESRGYLKRQFQLQCEEKQRNSAAKQTDNYLRGQQMLHSMSLQIFRVLKWPSALCLWTSVRGVMVYLFSNFHPPFKIWLYVDKWCVATRHWDTLLWLNSP